MDTVCRCGEPWDWWTIRDEVLKDQALYEKMAKYGGYVRACIHGPGYTEVPRKDIKAAHDRESVYQNEYWEFKPGPHPIQCPACFGKNIEPAENSDIIEALQDVLGDDVDGLMSSLEDFGLV